MQLYKSSIVVITKERVSIAVSLQLGLAKNIDELIVMNGKIVKSGAKELELEV